jgi:hypothetical protein
VVIWKTHKTADFVEWSRSMVKASNNGKFGFGRYIVHVVLHGEVNDGLESDNLALDFGELYVIRNRR